VASTLFETGGFAYADKAARSPDIQFHLGSGSGIEAGVDKLKNAGVTLNSAFLHPRSRGTVRLKSGDPSDHHVVVSRIGGCDTEHQARRRNDAVVCTQNSSSKPADASREMTFLMILGHRYK